MKPSTWLPFGASLLSGALAANPSWQTIPAIQASGQHFFYSNNGSQFFLKGVAYQQNYNANGSTADDTNTQYTDPLADGTACARDIPFMKQIYTNIIRVYALDPTKDHDDCMAQLASNDIYVIADLGQPGVSINSDDPAWNVELYQRYTSVIDAMSKYNNVVGFFAGNEVVEKANQTAAAAFVKAAVRDCKAYIKQQNYRTSMGVGYATADVPARDQLAAYFACEPTGGGTSIDFWGYNVYSWCGNSNYQTSSYGDRVNFFRDYPVPVFFAEYGCVDGVDGGPTHRPFTEVAVLYGNMTSVFSGGIVYQWFMSENHYGLVEIDGNSVKPYPDFTSLQSQLAAVTPSSTASGNYKPTNTAPACPTTDASWLPQASPLPPNVNPQLCTCEVAALSCVITSSDADKYGDTFDYICGKNAKYCVGIAHNASSGDYGAIGGCNPQQQLGFVANSYYLDNGQSSSACAFGGLASVQSPSTASQCSTLINAAAGGTGTVPSPTGQQGTAAASSSKAGAPGLNTPAFFNFGKGLFVAYSIAFLVSGVGIFVL
ncbi:Glucanosyltransferase-domain-containing protein [Xylariales sp. AK1849]|nr:Glucanosyltransferase-domain-containing protein [Xylariales sp. AK1849]